MSSNRLNYPLILCCAAGAVYFTSFFGTFQFDDYLVIVDNPRVHSWHGWWADLSRGGIRPLLKASYTLNWTLGPGLFGFHLFNVVVHAANAVMLYFFARDLLEHSADLGAAAEKSVSFLAALVFAVHPVQTEAVTYLSGRSTSLMVLFYLGALLSYIHGRKTGRTWLIFLLSPLLFGLSLGVKETAVTLPAALLLWETLARPGASLWRRAVRFQAVHWGLLVAVAVFLAAGERYKDFFLVSFDVRGLHDNLLTQINGVAYLLSRLVLFHRLNIDPDLPVFTGWHPVLAAEALFLAALLGLGVLNRRSRPWLWFGVLWFFLHLLPTNSVIPRIDVANERALYLAGWGLLFPGAVAGYTTLRKHAFKVRYAWAASFALSLVLAGFSLERSRVYRSEIALWEDTVSKSPLKPRAHNNLGYSYSMAGRHEEAKREYLRALELQVDYAPARKNLLNESRSSLRALRSAFNITLFDKRRAL
jgi:tetratricopeptide (TPR) repeat protein